MTINLRAEGTPTSATAAATAINPSPPAGWVSGDVSIMWVAARPDAVGCPTISGWTKLFEIKGGQDAFSSDSGDSTVACYIRYDSPVAPGNIAFTDLDANSPAGAVIHIYSKTASTNIWDLTSFTSVQDNTHASNYNATVGGTDIGLSAAAGDVLAFCQSASSDGGTVSAESISITGITAGTLTIRGERAISTGHDMRLRPGDMTLASGTSSAAPQHAYTNLQGQSGVTAFLRLREVALAAPGSFAGTPAQTSVSTTWAASSGATSYETRVDGGAATDRGNVTSYNFTGLTAGTAYTLEVRAIGPGGASTWSTLATTTIPANPTGLVVVGTPGPNNIELDWNAMTGATGYDVRVDGGAPSDLGNVTIHNFTGLTPATEYDLEVRAYNASGDSGWSLLTQSTGADPSVSAYEPLTHNMNRKAGTLVGGVPTRDATGAANIWAGTTGLDLVGALNVRAGNSRANYKDLVGVLNQLAGTTGLGIDGAASRIP